MLVVSIAASAAPGRSIEIQVRPIYVAGLLTELASLTGRHVALSEDFMDLQLPLEGRYGSFDAVLAEVARLGRGSVRRVGGIDVLSAGCAPVIAQALPPGLAANAVTVSFQRGGLEPILEALGEFASEDGPKISLRTTSPTRISVRVKKQPLRDVLQAMALANGLVWDRAGDAFAYSRQPGRAGCTEVPAPALQVHEPLRAVSAQTCPPRDPLPGSKAPACMQLERYALKELGFAGHVKIGAERVALVSTPDGLVWPLRVGDYVGRLDGKVLAVTPQGIRLRELLPRLEGGYLERDVTLAYGQVPDFPLSGSPRDGIYRPEPFACTAGLRHEKLAFGEPQVRVDKCLDAEGRRQGPYRVTRAASGVVEMEQMYRDDKRHGVLRDYDPEGVVVMEITYEDGVETGTHLRHRALEKLAAEFNESRRRKGSGLRMSVSDSGGVRYDLPAQPGRLKGAMADRQRGITELLCSGLQGMFALIPEVEVRVLDVESGGVLESHRFSGAACAAPRSS